ncbi:unnamed protein product [Scytosiphon promiscuus]
MDFHRRRFIGLTAAGIAATTVAKFSTVKAAAKNDIEAIAFDGFPILDPRPVVALASELYGPNGKAFFMLFRSRLFQYQWLRALGGQYQDFYTLINDAHLFAVSQMGLQTSDEKIDKFQSAFLQLRAWPDVKKTLQSLKARGIKLAFLSNMTTNMLNAGIENSGLDGLFDFVLSTDEIKTYKPDPIAYQLGVDAFNLPKQKIAFAAFASWDASGAKWFGYPTIWINRLNAKPERLGTKPDATSKDLAGLIKFVT